MLPPVSSSRVHNPSLHGHIVALPKFSGDTKLLVQKRRVSPTSAGRFGCWRHCTVMAHFPSLSEAEREGDKTIRPVVVVGSVNADIYVEIARLPDVGETISAVGSGGILPGGKGANQAACAARLGHETFIIGQVGDDANATLMSNAFREKGVRLDELVVKPNVPTGHAIVMLQPGGQNSIIIIGGSNQAWEKSPRSDGVNSFLSASARDLIRGAGVVLLQREITEAVNEEVAEIATSAGVPVILDAGGMDAPLPSSLLPNISILSPNETELSRLTGLPTTDKNEIRSAAQTLLDKGVGKLLLKLGEEGSMLLCKEGGSEAIVQPCILAPLVVDTTGAGDTFTAAFAVSMVEGRSLQESMRFAACAASLCVRKKGAMPSLPSRKDVDELFSSSTS